MPVRFHAIENGNIWREDFSLPRQSVIFLFDVSGDMYGTGVSELNAALSKLQSIWAQYQSSFELDISVMSFSDTVRQEIPFTNIWNLEPPVLKAGGMACLNQALLRALDVRWERIKTYRMQGARYLRPLLVLLSDGNASDSDFSGQAHAAMWDVLREKKILFLPIGVDSTANIESLESYFPPELPHAEVVTLEREGLSETFPQAWEKILEQLHWLHCCAHAERIPDFT